MCVTCAQRQTKSRDASMLKEKLKKVTAGDINIFTALHGGCWKILYTTCMHHCLFNQNTVRNRRIGECRTNRNKIHVFKYIFYRSWPERIRWIRISPSAIRTWNTYAGQAMCSWNESRIRLYVYMYRRRMDSHISHRIRGWTVETVWRYWNIYYKRQNRSVILTYYLQVAIINQRKKHCSSWETEHLQKGSWSRRTVASHNISRKWKLRLVYRQRSAHLTHCYGALTVLTNIVSEVYWLRPKSSSSMDIRLFVSMWQW